MTKEEIEELERKKNESMAAAREKQQKKMNARENEIEKWSAIKVDYQPELWISKYRELHKDNLSASISLLQKSSDNLSELDAEKQLFDILTKVTFVELNLMEHGQQTVNDLYDNLECAVENTQSMPFESVDELTTFLDSMVPIFHLKKACKLWQNTGTQFRRFCQFLVRRLLNGDVIEKKDFRKILNEFKETINVEEHLLPFARQEVGFDINDFRQLSSMVPDFHYENGCLSLANPSYLHLSLRLPILADTLHSSNPAKMDHSRNFTGFFSQFVHNQDRYLVCGLDEQLSGLKGSIFHSKMPNRSGEVSNTLITAHGFISPNNAFQQVEITEIQPTRFDFRNDFVTKKFGKNHRPNGFMTPMTFSLITDGLNAGRDLISGRTGRKYDVGNEEETEKGVSGGN